MIHSKKRFNFIARFWFVAAAISLVGLPLTRVMADDGTANDNAHVVTIYDRDVEQTVITKASDIRGALAQAQIELDEKDVVEPGLDEELVADSYQVNVYRARPVVIVDGGTRLRTITAAQSSAAIAESAGVTLYPEDNTELTRVDDMLSEGGAGLKLEVDRATPFTLVQYGETLRNTRTQAATVGEMLQERGVVLGAKDGVSVKPDTPVTRGMTVSVWRDGKQTVTRKEIIKKPVEQIQDADRNIGYRKVKTEGSDGVRSVTYQVTMRNGKVIKRKELASTVITPAVKQVVIVGTKNNYSGSLNDWLYKLRMCETHDNYQTNTGNGFYGAYQFMPSTWDSVARLTGRGDLVGVLPHKATPADQDAMIIANTNLTAGLVTQNPGCYASTGISNKPPGS